MLSIDARPSCDIMRRSWQGNAAGRRRGPPSTTGCIKVDDGQTLTLEWIPSPELTPFLPVTFTTTYWNRKDPGSFESAIARNAKTVDQICDPARGYDYFGLLDRYTSVTLRGYVAGMDHSSIPSLSRSISPVRRPCLDHGSWAIATAAATS